MSSGSSAGSAAPAARSTADERTGRVLDAMESRLARSGIRAVVMSELARELGMSTRTLYRTFPSKDALVLAVVERWADQLADAQERRLHSDMSAEERIRTAVRFLDDRRRRFCDAFWDDLRVDHPDAWHRYRSMVAAARRRSIEWTVPALHPGLDPVFARTLLTAMVERARQPETLAAAGMSREQALDAAVAIWSRGAFVDPDAPPPLA